MLTIRMDKPGLEKNVRDLRQKLKIFSTKEEIDRIYNEHIESNGLGSDRLHLNRKGNSQ